MRDAVPIDTVMAGREVVVQIGLEDTLLHQGRPARGVALVVHVERAELMRQVALIDHVDEGRRHRLADHVGVDAGADAVEVGLHAVTDRLMQQHAARARGQHDGHLAGRRPLGVEQHQGARHHLVHLRLEAPVGVEAQSVPRPERAQVALGLGAALGRDHQPQQDAGPPIHEQVPVERRDQHPLVGIGQLHRDLVDGRIGGTHQRLHFLNQRQLLVEPDLGPGALNRIEIALTPGVEMHRDRRPRAVRNGRGDAGGAQHGLGGQVLGEGIARLPCDHDAQSDPLGDVARRLTGQPVLHPDEVGALVLEVELGDSGPVGRQLGHHPADQCLIDAEPLEEWIGGRGLGQVRGIGRGAQEPGKGDTR